MAFRVSPCIGIESKKWEAVARYYQSHFGLATHGYQNGVEVNCGTIRFFIDSAPRNRVVLEMLSPNLDEARARCRLLGFIELLWRPETRSHLVEDPFGVVWNIFEEPKAFTVPDFWLMQENLIRPTIGIQTSSLSAAREFYGQLFEAAAHPLMDGSLLLETEPIRLRIEAGQRTCVGLWLNPEAVIANMEMKPDRRAPGRWLDPWGLMWRQEARPAPSYAIVPQGEVPK